MTETICAIYKRISTDEDLQKWSLAGQHEELTRFAEKRGWQIYKTYKDEITGSAAKRPGLDELRNDMVAGCFSIILVVDQDRISRMETIDWELFKKELRECSVKIVTPAQEIDFEDEDSELVSDVFNLFARHQRRKLKKAMRRGREQAIKAGKWLGRVPYGYKSGENGKLFPDPETAWVVQYIFREYAKGKGGYKLAYYDLDHIPSPNGIKWNKEVVTKIVRNPIYTGQICFNGYNGLVQVDNAHEALVDKRTFELCQEILQGRGNNHFYMTQNRSHTLLNGVLVCECGKALVVKPVKKTLKGKRYEYYYYKHPKPTERPNKGIFAPQRECKASYRTERLDRAIVDAVKQIGSSPQAARKLIRLNSDQGEIRKLEAQLTALEQSEDTIQAKLGKLLKLYLRSDWDEKTLNIEKAALEKNLRKNHQEQRTIREKLALVNRQNVTLEVIMEYFALLANFETEVSIDDQRRIIQTIFPRIEVKKNGNIIATARIPITRDSFQSACQLQVAGNSRLHGNFGGLMVSYLADHDDIRVLPQDRAQVAGKGNSRLHIHLDLVNTVQHIFNRVFHRYDVFLNGINRI